MKASQYCIDLICRYEGFRSNPYLDPANVPTIGYGSTYYANGQSVTLQDDPISEQQAKTLMKSVLSKYEAAVNRYVQVVINQNQFDALVSFSYNLGNENLRTSTLLKRINAGLFEEAGNEFLKWVYAGGNKLAGLERRRKEERALFLTPQAKSLDAPILTEVNKGEVVMLNGYKTYIGIAISLLSGLAAALGKDWGIDWAGVEVALVALVGAAISVYGYVKKEPK